MSIHKRIWKNSTHKPPEVSSPNSAAPLFAASRIRWIGDGKSVKGPVEKCLPELLAQLPGANRRLGMSQLGGALPEGEAALAVSGRDANALPVHLPDVEERGGVVLVGGGHPERVRRGLETLPLLQIDSSAASASAARAATRRAACPPTTARGLWCREAGAPRAPRRAAGDRRRHPLKKQVAQVVLRLGVPLVGGGSVVRFRGLQVSGDHHTHAHRVLDAQSHLGEGVAVLGRLPPAADHLAHLGLELAPEVRPVELAPLHSKGHREVAPGRALPERPRAGGEPRPADGARLGDAVGPESVDTGPVEGVPARQHAAPLAVARQELHADGARVFRGRPLQPPFLTPFAAACCCGRALLAGRGAAGALP
mmetsp:Transcript_34691/g.78435  ORF Transcript_34691/g.78435 Transcript_34691/m.78435 type:complete len:367 (-) Transcript_34691:286-1386(-)